MREEWTAAEARVIEDLKVRDPTATSVPRALIHQDPGRA